jgi:hypothetical protein
MLFSSLIAIDTIILIYILLLYSAPSLDELNTKMEDEFYNTIKTGDIIFIQSNDYESRIIRLVTKSPFSHAGIACWYNNQLYLCESYPDADDVTDQITGKIKAGPRFVLFKDKLKYYNKWYLGNVKFGVLPISKEISSEKLINEIYKIYDLTFASDYFYFFNYIRQNTNLVYRNEMVCFELVGYLYKQLGIIEDTGVYQIFLPNDFLHKKIKYMNNYSNSNLIKYSLNKSNDNILIKIIKFLITL